MKVYIVIHDDTGEGGAVVMVTTTRDKAVKMCADPGSSLVWEEHDLDAPLFEMEQKRLADGPKES